MEKGHGAVHDSEQRGYTWNTTNKIRNGGILDWEYETKAGATLKQLLIC